MLVFLHIPKSFRASSVEQGEEITSLRATQGGSSLGDLGWGTAIKERTAMLVFFVYPQEFSSKLGTLGDKQKATRSLRVASLLLLGRDEEIRTLGLQLPKLAR